ncbi:stage II sporulation protein P [Brotonthovivens ammoniilytica]|uniref:Stage II sporulation protein P n=1 Tax=Brotonthovivens ammoniilytica TaxID=2981725 RepID=A0ABT2TMG6_9FIRM|nr:stage II sporulation protein P [Brotonthovivens ammoniilytica]MCU6763414.1 stage II sporulation protein P [Brotonthovivens ammoniilytica]
MLILVTRFEFGEFFQNIKYETCFSMFQNISPALAAENPLYTETAAETIYKTQTESDLDYETILAQEAASENEAAVSEETVIEENEKSSKKDQPVTISKDKLKDFDYLLQKFYTVDKTTTIKSSQLNADSLLKKDCKLSQDNSKPQILIYHTHSLEGYKDSKSGDLSTTVVGVGDYLTKLLKEKYGYNVIHDRGTYDKDRDNAYSVAGPALEKILAKNPSIEVVIDLHRDGVNGNTKLVTETNGKKMAQVMFFNGLSRTTAVGDIDYLHNPYIADNLAFSFQLQLQATQQYPGFARKIYLKGYRYNMHYRPKSLLVEVGAQTNTLQEAKNAMEPLAEVLDSVLSGEN